VTSPGTDTKRLNISLEASRLEVRRNAGRVAYGRYGVLAARVADIVVRVNDDDNYDDHDDNDEHEWDNDCNAVT
jgi:hypothetical protein